MVINMVEKIKLKLQSEKMQQIYIVLGVLAMIIILFAVRPFASDGYEDISDRTSLDQRVATALSNGETELLIDYSGEDWVNMKNWFKEDFKYNKLIKYTDEFTIYNYDGAKYSYWTYGTKKRVKVTISYKLNKEQIAAVGSFAENYINQAGLRNMSTYDAIKTTHDYLIDNYVYKNAANNLYNMINSKQANCYGYTMMNYVILDKLGIPVRTTYGATRDNHIWNVVQVDGQWYYEDITWDTSNGGTDYMLVSSDKITKDHTIYGNFIVDCPSDYVVTNQEPIQEETSNEIVQDESQKEEIQPDVENTEVVDEDKEEVIEEPSNSNNDTTTPSKPTNETINKPNTPTNVQPVTQKEKIRKLIEALNALKKLKQNR